MKSFSERNPVVIGAVGVVAVAGLVLAALQQQNLPFLHQGTTYSAYFADAGGLSSSATVEVSGLAVGKVSSIHLDGPRVLVTFKIDKNVRLGDRTAAAIKIKSLLGSKIIDLTPAGTAPLNGAIPLERTTSPYQLGDTLGDLATTVSGLNTDQLSESLATLAHTFSDTPPQLKTAVEGIARFSQTLNTRDAQLRNLLANASKATTVLARRTDQIVGLVKDTNALLAALRSQSSALDQIWANLSAVSRQLKGFIAENRQQLRPALDKLNGALAIVDTRKERIQQSIKLLNTYALTLGETFSSGPFFKAYVWNLLPPGQWAQGTEAAFAELGLDPATLLPSQLTGPQVGQPATPALPLPYPRTGQGGEPRLSIPDAITGNPGDQPCGLPGLPLPGPGCFPYRQPPPAPPPGGPPPGPPALPPPGQGSTPEPTPSPVYVPAPGEVPPAQSGAQP